ncbi:MAG TPA: DEAD/DEAH box helicase family protein [Opitutus sp.]|nr:DEAD/DEAH box helicase family protein [Opitutus sp.]
MNEAETRAELIDPALRAAGWGVVEQSRVRREQITKGRLLGAGIRGEPTTADYVLIYRGKKLGVIEAKKRDAALTEGLGQAKAYAGKLQTRFAFSTNGQGFYQVDMQTGAEGEIAAFPTPDALWAATFAEENAWRDRFAAVPLSDHGGKQAHYYQDIAIERVLEKITAGDKRILLTLATGTGKTFIAFQLAWKLFHARWNLTGEPTRRPRILFLADRNILADQAYNSFSAFAEDARARISPEEVRKTGRVPKNANIFFTIFQTFMAGASPFSLAEKGLGDEGRSTASTPESLHAPHPPAPSPPRDRVAIPLILDSPAAKRPVGGGGEDRAYFYDYPPDFFDFIIIDECHRGGAQDESSWRDIMEYFAPAVQLGLTATPRRQGNADTYRYFGEPAFTYSLKEGINDGFLTPFKVRQFATTMDDYTYVADDIVLEGDVEAGDTFTENDFNTRIEIMEREQNRVNLFMREIDQNQKTLVFCANQAHAAAVRDLINQAKTSRDPNYCVRVTAKDGALGDHYLRAFQDNEKTIPTILTTSHKLSTGVDARNVRNIVLMRPIKSMIEFKQIIGRGTRLYDGKDYFTIYDFVKAHALFSDPEWDGEPAEPDEGPKRPTIIGEPIAPIYDPEDPAPRPQRIKIRLADGKERRIQHMAQTMFYSPDGTPIPAAAFIEKLFGDLPELFKDEAELRTLWGDPTSRKRLISGLAERGYGPEQLHEIGKLIEAENSDVFDVLAYIAFALAPLSRAERVTQHRAHIMSAYDSKLQTFLDFVLDQYVRSGVEELDAEKLPSLLTLKYQDLGDAVAALGGVPAIRGAFLGFQPRLYGKSGGAQAR